ncbi:hypothetical protein J4G43_049775 [Bradyrhizobium barranii subsp. barranii]|uniref:Uncharacterized protein n=1 Tax=Bradyrhizobium barranii subsp. barranii TaxID=2823807 RepID=A0A939S0M9_9BRAD|nr:hypothetical protein [Bradyrhizobium barranii]UEM12398.1 hypothetical protein J4G43_049775 [Bradyrhizobium barranii subsp. barranii]
MPKISIDLENCYGIKKLKADFDFKKARAFAIYAPNGAMKSSLATTFQDIAAHSRDGDQVFQAMVITDSSDRDQVRRRTRPTRLTSARKLW